jgi:hypothetical protein
MESLASLAPGDFSVSGVAGKRARGEGLAADRGSRSPPRVQPIRRKLKNPNSGKSIHFFRKTCDRSGRNRDPMTNHPSCVKEGSVASRLEGVGLSVRALDLSLLKGARRTASGSEKEHAGKGAKRNGS